MTLLDASPVPVVTSDDRAQRLIEAGTVWNDRIDADSANAELTYRVAAESHGSVATKVTAGKHEFLVDEPAALAGDDAAASPVEYALGALLSCQVVLYRLWAQRLGIAVDEISIASQGDLDARELFGIDGGPRAGFTDVRLEITITGPETEERYRALRETVDAHCPVLDLFQNPTPVTVSVQKG